jgi:hypothetical protein
VSAKELEDEGINNYYINAVVVENGDIIVEEYFEVVGEYNGYEREINYRNPYLFPFYPDLDYYGPSNIVNGSGISLVEIRAVDKDSKFDFEDIGGKKFTETDSARKGDYGVYLVDHGTSGDTYQIYLPSSKNKAFYIKYRLKNMATRYNDVSEFWWPLPIDGIKDDIKTLKVNMSLKNESNLFRVWAHGPLDGIVENINNTTLRATVKNVSSLENDIDLRMVFDRSYLNDSSKSYDVVAFDKIVAYETDEANEANYEREQIALKKLEDARKAYQECDENPYMYCYENVLEKVEMLEPSKEKDELLGYLPDLRYRAMEDAKNDASSSVEHAAYTLEYEDYEDALEDINIIDDGEFKDNLLTELEAVKEQIYKKEVKINNILVLFNIAIGLIFILKVLIQIL